MSTSLAYQGAQGPALSAQAHAATAAAKAAATQFISFAIGGDHYGVDIMAVREIKGCSEINQLPNQPDYIRGVINLRGVIAPAGSIAIRACCANSEAAPDFASLIRATS